MPYIYKARKNEKTGKCEVLKIKKIVKKKKPQRKIKKTDALKLSQIKTVPQAIQLRETIIRDKSDDNKEIIKLLNAILKDVERPKKDLSVKKFKETVVPPPVPKRLTPEQIEDLKDTVEFEREMNEGPDVRDMFRDMFQGLEEATSEAYAQEPIEKMKERIDGSGSIEDSPGLSNLEIDEMMKDDPEYKGCIANDQLKTLGWLPSHGPMSCIINTDNAKKPGQHWRALRIDPKDAVEFYDPFGEESDYNKGKPDLVLSRQIKRLISGVPHMLKYKINSVKNQDVTTNNCGFICMLQLMKRAHMGFPDSTNFVEPEEDMSQKTEEEINVIKKKFGYI